MYVDCNRCPLRQTAQFRPLEGQELEFVRSVKRDQIDFPARSEIITAGEPGQLYTLYSGWAFRYMMLDGTARQILDVMLPGDLIGLQSPLTGQIRHSVRAITSVSLCVLDGHQFKSLFEDLPDLAEALMATLLYEEHRADRRLLMLGRLRSTQRLAYLLLEIEDRLSRRGYLEDDSFELPLSYELMADMIGVSRAQLGASLLDIKHRGWAELDQRRLVIRDRAAMASACRYSALPDVRCRALI
ncbi:Crp/Fnr family transcriptional regulator [Sphingomonas sp. GCM10030256]|uniref:Crp/Fnr family transcriptional regulator n=1 Tax=Sphingomonas sp. GCM10030256 TaxID=3273427 RepID=UPI0036067059